MISVVEKWRLSAREPHRRPLEIKPFEFSNELIIIRRIENAICKEPEKYGVEYVTAPSDLYCGVYKEFISDEIEKLIDVEKSVLERIQKEDGGFDISWQWYTEYSEFEQAKKWWRPRITLDKLMCFCRR